MREDVMEPTGARRLDTLTKVLLACGILSSVLYVGTELLASLLYQGYSYGSQMVSELSAIGAPTRPMWVTMSFLYNPLVLAFGAGVWRAGAGRRSVRITAGLLVAYAAISMAGLLTPMQQRGNAMALTDIGHIACTIGMVVSMLLFVGFGSAAAGKGWRAYSLLTLAAIVAGGALAGMSGVELAAGGATPFMGIVERVNIYAEMLWVAMLGVMLLRSSARGAKVLSRATTRPALGRPAVADGR